MKVKKRKSMRLGLTFTLKLSLLYALFFITGIMALFGAAYYLMNGLVEEGEREVVSARVQEYRAWFAEGGLQSLKKRFYAQSSHARDIIFVRIVSPRNNVLFLSIPPGASAFDFNQLNTPNQENVSWFSIITGTEKKTAWTVASTSLDRGLTLQVGKSSTQSRQLLEQLRYIFLVFAAPVLLLGILGGGVLTFRAMAPLRHLIKTVRDIISTGKTSVRVPGRAERGELGQLVYLFNQMLDKNDSLITAMHESLDNVAHDLRTPMTRLRGVAEFALSDPENSEACLEALADCMEESERVLYMLNTLMDVAEAETGAMRLQLQEVQVTEITGHVTDLYELVAEDKNISLKTDIPEDLSILADPSRAMRVLANLVDNAIKYSPENSEVRISASKMDNWAVISVSDQGPGIPDCEKEKIWDRLYRGDQSRSRRGLGLGLSFVRAIVLAHGGDVHVENSPDKGSVFIITFKIPDTEEIGE